MASPCPAEGSLTCGGDGANAPGGRDRPIMQIHSSLMPFPFQSRTNSMIGSALPKVLLVAVPRSMASHSGGIGGASSLVEVMAFSLA